MSGLDQLQYLSWLLYLIVFGAVLVRTIRRPTPAHVDMTLFFGAAAILILTTTLTSRLRVAQPTSVASDITGAAAMSLGYLLLRLVRDFSDVPFWLMRAVEAGMVVSILAIVLSPSPLPPGVALLLTAYLVLVIAYDTWAFARQAGRSRGVTTRRMQAAAAGSLSLTLDLIVTGVAVAVPPQAAFWTELGAALGLLSGVCYFVAFAPPTWLRRAWQEPEVRTFLARAASLSRLPDTRAIVRELERGAASALGAPAASISLWDPDTRRLRAFTADGADWLLDPEQRPISGNAFLKQRASLTTDATLADPDNAAEFERFGVKSVLAAPINAGDKRLGALVVFAPRTPVFANSDLELVQLLADQAAVILENRALIEESAALRAREEATRLKEDFLSSAAHDLKTPLTGLVTQAQVLQRRVQRQPNMPIDRVGIDRLLAQSLRLRDLVLKLLDVSRLEQGGLLGNRVALDLGQLVRTQVEREPAWRRVQVEIEAAPAQRLVAEVDEVRFSQVVANLVENALKYSQHTSPVVIRIWREAAEVRLSVHDDGIGIPLGDQPHVFDRFHRAENVDDRRFAGMGLGLYIARGMVEQHGGRIWVVSKPGDGSTFFVSLPAADAAADSASGTRVAHA